MWPVHRQADRPTPHIPTEEFSDRLSIMSTAWRENNTVSGVVTRITSLFVTVPLGYNPYKALEKAP